MTGRTCGSTMTAMGVRKRSVALEEEVAEEVVNAAVEDAVSVSAWLSEAARQRLRLRRGMNGVAEWEATARKLSAAEIAAGEALLDRLLGVKRPRTRRAG